MEQSTRHGLSTFPRRDIVDEKLVPETLTLICAGVPNDRIRSRVSKL